ncbi:MAG: bifunctional adenosylcobinamide kinase/adenosylcobinamide-phosphate guanylyltransferase [Prevotellaceae bacterium]|nr:bifunctional adenosylcobinamide kinase/adenosylcobinamide-phosphate guanylyltransferase [Prevotellaceae bacterium]
MRKIILVTGGARSGKSSYAERLALGLSASPVYIATARVWDDEFRLRIAKHQQRRGDRWRNIEEEKELSKHRMDGETVVVDCLTLWSTNFFFDLQADVDRALNAIKAEFDRFTSQEATFIFVTNEIGMGGTSQNALQRKFTDLMGWVNQYVAALADEVILMVSGIPVHIKGTPVKDTSLASDDSLTPTTPTTDD